MAMTIVVMAVPAVAQSSSDYPPDVTTTTQAPAKAAAQIAFTGSDSKPLVIIGLIAVALGAVLVVATRRRSSVRATKA